MNSQESSVDQRIRLASFAWLSKQTKVHGDVLQRQLLTQGFEFEGKRVPLVGPQGIFKPQALSKIPLSITTTSDGPYDDSFDHNGLLMYRYRGTDPNHKDNEGLRTAMKEQIPLIYFHGIVPGKYYVIFPVFIVGDIPHKLTFKVAADDPVYFKTFLGSSKTTLVADSNDEARRAYLTATIKQRLHQRGFREKVLLAYRQQCSFCRLRHPELLDAAHIIPDSEPEGIPTVQNGIALCKLHHAAFDSYLLGLRPDYIIEVRKDVLDEEDGPMLLHGLKNLSEKRILLPSPPELSPSKILLEKRYAEFKIASQ